MATERLEDRLTFTLLWRIENFSFWNRECHGGIILSPIFRALSLGDSVWLVRFFPESLSNDSVCFQIVCSNAEISVDSEMSFIDDSGSATVFSTLLNEKLSAGLPYEMNPQRSCKELFASRKSSFLPNDTLTIRCRLWNSNKNLDLAEHCSAWTRIEVQETSILCPLSHFREFEVGPMETIPVPLNASSELSLLRMVFSLQGMSICDASVNCEIVPGKIKKPLTIAGKILVLNSNRQVFKCVEDRYEFSPSQKQTWTFPTLVSREELMTRSDCLRHNVLTLLCEFRANTGKMHDAIEKNSYGPENLVDTTIQRKPRLLDPSGDSLAKMQEDFSTLYKQGSLSDFTLGAGEASFPVHKNVLSARSPVFRGMFSGDVVNSEPLNVPDVDSHTLDLMLTFLYTGTVPDLDWEHAAKLYYAADKYQVSTLKQECTSVLKSDIAVFNVCDILSLADRHQDDDLTSFVHDFILDHYDDIMLSNEWGRFLDNESRLAGKTMRHVYKNKLGNELGKKTRG